MNLRQLEYFLQVARHKSLSHAATALRMGQPALSRHIRSLEVELRSTLFHRNGRGLTLTDAGVRFLAHATNALDELNLARETIHESPEHLVGSVAIGLPPSVARAITVPLVKAFQQRLPKARISIGEGLSTALQEKILTGRLDLAVMHSPSPSPMLQVTPLFEENLLLLSLPSCADRFERKAQVTIEEIASLPLIFPSQPHPIRRLVEAAAARQGITIDVALEIEALATILGLVQAGCGSAIVPESVLWDGAPRQGIEARRFTEPSMKGRLALVKAARQPGSLLLGQAEGMLVELLTALKSPETD